MPKKLDVTDHVFGRWTAICKDPTSEGRHTYWICSCSCGNFRSVCVSHLRRRATNSCGCLQRELASKKGPLHPGWKGGKTKTKAGYIRILGDQNIFEHRHVMEQSLGRELTPDETVHHINGIRTDNRPENLELWSKSHPPGQRVEDLVTWARQILATYTSP